MIQVISTQLVNHGAHFRAYGIRGQQNVINPFLGVDHAWMNGPTFPPHSHAGFSAVSYLFLDSETGLMNRDSTGTVNLIKPGGLHWAAAGKGIVHEEVPAELGKTAHSLQIFINLPTDKKSMDPKSYTLEAEDVPSVQIPSGRVRVPVGSYQEVRSPLKTPTDVVMLDISLNAGASIDLPVPAKHTVFVMPIFGAFSIDNQSFSLEEQKVPVFLPKTDDKTITLTAFNKSAKVMYFSGQPL